MSTAKDSKFKKDLKIPYVSHSICLLIIVCTLHAKFQQKTVHVCKAAAGGLLLEISYIPLLSVMTLHYHGEGQISNLEANLSLEDLKQLCRQTQPKTNN